MTLEEIKRLNLRDALGQTTVEKIPTLEEYMLSAKGRVRLYLDKTGQADGALVPQILKLAKKCGTLEETMFVLDWPYGKARKVVGDDLEKVLYCPVIEEKIKASQQEREEIAGVQKKSRERAKKTAVYNRKLRDCRFHFSDTKFPKGMEGEREKTSIFITEGDSASGTITKVRNANNQAVFSLRGKPLNCQKEGRKKLAENEELNLLIAALGVEEDLDNLRYNNIIVATDADDDGMHIRMLVLTFFMKYYPELIRRGHVFILQTPLFRVHNKKERRYCYSAEERDKAVKALRTGVEITRFKGLGEISADEFVDFIGDNIRLDQVKLSEEESIQTILEFYMDVNTYERQHFIMDNLRSEKELEDVDI